MLSRVTGELNDQQVLAFHAPANAISSGDLRTFGCCFFQDAEHLSISVVCELKNGSLTSIRDAGEGNTLPDWEKRASEFKQVTKKEQDKMCDVSLPQAHHLIVHYVH